MKKENHRLRKQCLAVLFGAALLGGQAGTSWAAAQSSSAGLSGTAAALPEAVQFQQVAALAAPKVAALAAPSLVADAVNNIVGRDVTITFSDNPAWRSAITSVTLGSRALAANTDYTLGAGSLKLKSSLITQPGDYTVTVKAAGYNDAQLVQTVGKWQMIWNDEFDGSGTNVDTNGVNLDKWGYQNGTGAEYGLDGWGNNEQEYYSKDNLQVQNGLLTITAKKQNMNGKPYTSGRLWTSPTFSKQYGRFEARIKMPEGQGLWPAFWMMPKDSAYGTWASSGEIDIMEARGRLPQEVSGTIHYGKPWPNNKSTGADYVFPAGQSISNDFHTYAVEWEPGEIRWYVDDHLFQTANQWSSEGVGLPDKYAFPAPFDKSFYIILNMAVGGTFDGNLNPPDSALPAQMQVDYVRAYELTGKPYKTPVEPVLDKEPIPADARQPVDGSYIADPAFAQGLTDITNSSQPLAADKWNFLHTPDYGGAGSASIDTIGGQNYAKIVPTNGGSQNYSLQLIQYAPLVKGHIYKLSFDAKASAERSMAVKMGGDADNAWAAYSDNFDVPLKTSLQHYEYRFQMANATDLTARLEFNLGLNTSTAWIGNVRLEETDMVVDPNGAKTPLDDGNHVYNGTFDLGTMDRMKYWNFTTNGASATAGVDPEVRQLAVAIQNGGSSPQAIQLSQKGINLLQTDVYELTFDAKAAANRTIGVRFVSKDGTNVYGQVSGITLGTSMAAKQATFTMPAGINDTEGQLVFDLGGSNSAVSLDNVVLIRTTNNNADYTKVSLYPLLNGDFSAGLSYWEPFTQGSAANFSAADGAAKVSISNVGAETWSVMLNQSNLKLTKGFTYKVAFDAKSSAARDAEVTLEDAAYNRWFDSGMIPVGTNWQHYEYTLKPTADGNVAIKFQFGKTPQAPAGAHDVYLRNVVLEVQNAPLARPQTLLADNTDNRLGQPVELRFTDNAAWRNAITGVLVNGEPLAAQDYTVGAGVITLGPGAFDATGTYTVTVQAQGYADISVTQTMIASDGNLVSNGSFDKGEDNWEFWVANAGDSVFDAADGTANLDIHYYGGYTTEWGDPVAVSWYTQLMQSGIQLEAGKTYELSFRAWSTVNRPILIELTGYNNNQQIPFSITGNAGTVYTAVLKPAAATSLTIKYLLGNVITGSETTPDVAHVFHIDDVSLKEVKGGPQLTADTTDNKAGSAIQLTFADDPAWRSAITGIKINGNLAPANLVTVAPGVITLDPSLFPALGSYTIGVVANGYGTNEVTQQILTASANIALGKAVTASSSAQAAENAVDGNTNTRWESDFSDPQWIAVNLGGVYTIDTVVLNWEAAYGKAYKVQVTTAENPGESDWQDWYSEPASDGGFDTIQQPPVDARYVRILGTQRGTGYGYSLWELEVYGTPSSGQPNPGNPGDGNNGGNGGDESGVNLALNHPVVASSSNTNFDPNVITDGNAESRWEANYNAGSSSEWVYVDLGAVKDVKQLVIKWERAYPTHVDIQVANSPDNEANWQTVGSLDRDPVDANWTETVDLSGKNAQGRYVRLYMTGKHFPPYGPSIFELEVYA